MPETAKASILKADGGKNQNVYQLSVFKTGYSAGLLFKHQIGDQLDVITGLTYETRGLVVETNVSVLSVTTTFDFTYLQIPVLLSFSPAQGLGLKAGPELGVNLSSDVKVESGAVTTETDRKDDTQNVDLGLTMGLDFTVAEMVLVGASYTLGLLNTDAADYSGGTELEGTMMNTNVKIGAGYSIELPQRMVQIGGTGAH